MNKALGFFAVAVIVAGVVWWTANQPVAEEESENDNVPSSSQQVNPPPPSPINNGNNDEEDDQPVDEDEGDDEEEMGNVWYGELKLSNSSKRGNLMLLVEDSDRIVYINTSRDYTELLDKSVAVTFEGDFSDFMLLDIKPK